MAIFNMPDQYVADKFINPLLNSSGYPLLRKYVEEHISNITLDVDEKRQNIVFNLVDDDDQLSVHSNGEHTAESEEEIRDWLTSVGLDIQCDDWNWLNFIPKIHSSWRGTDASYGFFPTSSQSEATCSGESSSPEFWSSSSEEMDT
ncbi:hypothetical protein NX059_012007 [Plenodomus lindquistii]|nr:hypothetical protein NX059_012007 [Plenodomus lindquistii]